MGRGREIHLKSEPVTKEERAFANLWRPIVHGVNLINIQVITRPGYIGQVFCKQADNGAWLFIVIKGKPTLVRPICYLTVSERRREQSPYVLHQEKLGLNVLDEAQEIPKQCAARVLNCRSLSSCAERLAGRPPNNHIDVISA
ncbi:MAG: hypothetical protein A2045_02485 [Rhodocyclales bacterium GWA2_65_20]|nr:MAG: hypothetical protein A2045_02485 [Rhodocyclales bacterium GWA2_65_20]